MVIEMEVDGQHMSGFLVLSMQALGRMCGKNYGVNSHLASLNLSCCFVADYNVLLSESEKLGSPLMENHALRRFREVLQVNSFTDVSFAARAVQQPMRNPNQ